MHLMALGSGERDDGLQGVDARPMVNVLVLEALR